MPICRICNNSNLNKSYIAREMMFGYRDEFEYFECAECGCVQILEFPSNLSKYYPENYYSFQKLSLGAETRSSLSIFAHKQRAKYKLGYGNWLGKFIDERRNYSSTHQSSSLHFFDWLREAKVRLDDKILDLGCGVGHLLLEFQRNGFSNLTGVDPFIESDIFYGNGIKIFKKEVSEIQEKFDFIMLNHSFEHMEDPLSVLKELWKILKPNRYILIRIPVASSFSWRYYQVNWVQLDAPRHLFLHTLDSMKILSAQANLKLEKIVYDSIPFQFMASDRYVDNIPLFDSERPFDFSKRASVSLQEKADSLNANNDGDQACFYLYKA